jgi:predicted ATPase
VVPAIAQTLSLREAPGRSLTETLGDYLSSKEMVLILDNFEQVMDAAAEVSALVASSSSLKVVVTSREALRIEGEREFPLHPLALPSSEGEIEEILGSPAVELFVARARAVRPGLGVNGEDARHVAAICRRLDGLPLAIELAAARVKVLSLAALASRLETSLAVVGTGRRDASARQRTLQGAIAWSYELLDEDEQRLFARLGVFAGGWSLEAAEAVCDRNDLAVDVLDGIASLVDKSLVRVEGDEARFSMLETIREFSLEKLEESGEAHEIRSAHAEYFRALAEEAEPHLVGADQKEWLDRLELDLPNLRVALNWWARQHDTNQVAMAAALRRFWWSRGYLGEGRRWLEIITSSEWRHSTEVRANVLYALAFIAQAQGDTDAARASGQESLRLYTQLRDERGAARTSETLAWVAEESGNYALARSLYERSLATWRSVGDKRGVLVSTANLGNLALLERDYPLAIQLTKQSLALAEEISDSEGSATILVNLGLAYLHLGTAEEALRSFKRSLALAQELRHTELMILALIGLAGTAGALDKPETALRLLGAVDKLCEATSTSLPPLERELRERTLSTVGAALDDRATSEGLRAGRQLSLDDALTEAAGVGRSNT